MMNGGDVLPYLSYETDVVPHPRTPPKICASLATLQVLTQPTETC